MDTTRGAGNPTDDRSVPSQVQTREELGAALTALRVSAGLSVRDVVRSVPSLTLGTASGWFSGGHVPTRASESTLVEMLRLLGVDDAPAMEEWRAAVERVRSLPGPRRTR
ncbi:helix-turn-helix domain-containing protein, partial [Dietzia sp. HMSC21D01]